MQKFFGWYARYGSERNVRFAIRLAVIGVALAGSLLGHGSDWVAFAGDDGGD